MGTSQTKLPSLGVDRVTCAPELPRRTYIRTFAPTSPKVSQVMVAAACRIRVSPPLGDVTVIEASVSRAAAIEKSKVAECEEVRKAKLFLVEDLRFLNVPNRTRNLSDGSERQSRHFQFLSVQRACFGNAVPKAERSFVVEAELGKRIRHVIFHGVDADPELFGDTRIGHSVSDKFNDAPLGWRQLVVMGRASAAIGHGTDNSADDKELPYPKGYSSAVECSRRL